MHQLDTIPTVAEKTRSFKLVKAGRGMGIDSLPPALYKAFPRQLAMVYAPLFVKVSMHITEPAQWHGGALAFIPIRFSVGAQCGDNRKITLADVCGKVFHKATRRRARPEVNQFLRHAQFGSNGTDLASLSLRTT